MTTATPQVPPRPNRAQDQGSAKTGNTLGSNIPQIPPRPVKRTDRSLCTISAQRNAYSYESKQASVIVQDEQCQQLEFRSSTPSPKRFAPVTRTRR
ncbi:hypothetical protein CJF30_00000609 [Rutstroemia sp. NJR-2017a BBW]|nr:hypothetical protein CJF30_00000609 [Rutstroemia sp. NJR-2017a BBW]